MSSTLTSLCSFWRCLKRVECSAIDDNVRSHRVMVLACTLMHLIVLQQKCFSAVGPIQCVHFSRQHKKRFTFFLVLRGRSGSPRGGAPALPNLKTKRRTNKQILIKLPPHLLVVLKEGADLREAVRRHLADVRQVLVLGVVQVHSDDLGIRESRSGKPPAVRVNTNGSALVCHGNELQRQQQSSSRQTVEQRPPGCAVPHLVVALALVQHAHHTDGAHVQEGEGGNLGGAGVTRGENAGLGRKERGPAWGVTRRPRTESGRSPQAASRCDPVSARNTAACSYSRPPPLIV